MKTKTISIKNHFRVTLSLAVSLYALLSCSGSTTGTGSGIPQPDDQNYTGYLVQVESDDQFSSLIKSSYANENTVKNTDDFSTPESDGASTPQTASEPSISADSSAEDASTSGTTSEASSSTTLIEAGVDEMDIMKFDDNIIYQSRSQENSIQVFRVDDKQAKSTHISSIQLNDNNSDENNDGILGLYIYNQGSEKTLVVISQHNSYTYGSCLQDTACVEYMLPITWSGQSFKQSYYDVSKPETPIFSYSEKFEGYFYQSRRIDNKLYTVSSLDIHISNYNQYPDTEDAIKENQTLLNNLNIEDLIPDIKKQSSDTGQINLSWFESKHCYIPEGVSSSAQNLHLTVITSKDLQSGSTSANCFLGYTKDFYASTKSLYFSESGSGDSNQYQDFSRIHQFNYNETGVSYAGSGSVVGQLSGSNSKFRMNEYDGYLRVLSSRQRFGAWDIAMTEPNIETSIETSLNTTATDSEDASASSSDGDANSISPEDSSENSTDTETQAPAPLASELDDADHFLSVLQKIEGERELVLVSRIPNQVDDKRIGKQNEDVYAVRFIKDHAYVVTFLQTDPFYIIDLADQLNPVVTGELEIPGFSTQLFPINDDYLLGIGNENGLKLDVYDVRDSHQPLRSSQFKFDTLGPYFYSPAQYDHHAISMLNNFESNLMKLSIPAYSYSSGNSKGLYLFEINTSVGNIESAGFIGSENSVYDSRSIIGHDNIHFVTDEAILSAPWDTPSQTSIEVPSSN